MSDLFGCQRIEGKFCHLIPLTGDDAELVFNLRTKRTNSFLKDTEGNVEDQRRYISDYYIRHENGEEIYFKILDAQRDLKEVGVVRLTELDQPLIFNWQSLVVSESASPQVAIDTMLIIYSLGFELLGKMQCGPWEVLRGFSSMMKLHERIGMAEIVGETDKVFQVQVQEKDFGEKIAQFRRMGFGTPRLAL